MWLYHGVTRVLGRGAGISTLLAIALVFSGCQDSSKTVEEYLQSAQEHRLAGDFNAAVIELKSALQRNPDSSAARFMLGQIYLEISDGASAEKELMRAQELGMSEEATRLPLAQSWLLQRQHDRIINDLAVPAEDDPEYVRILVLRGQALLGLGNLDASEEIFDMALAKEPESLDANIGLARVALARNDLETAQVLQAKVEDMNPDAIESLALKGDVAFLKEDYAEASDIFGALVERRPQNLFYRVSQAWAQVGSKEYKTAAKSLDVILRATPNNTQVQYLRGLTHYNLQEYIEARNLMSRVLAQESDYAPALLIAGAASYATNEYEQARNHLSRLVSLAPRFEQGRKLLAMTQMQLGQQAAAAETLRPLMVDASEIEDEQTLRLVATAALQSGDLKSGKNYIEKAVERSPDDARLRAQLGMTRISLGEVDEGLADLETAAQQDAESANEDALLVYSLIRSGELDRALEIVETIKETEDSLSLGYVLEGAVYVAKQDEEKAIETFRKALEVEPSRYGAAEALAGVYMRRRAYEDARNVYRDYLDNNPDSASALLRLSQTEALLGNNDKVTGYLERLIEVKPNIADLRVYLARLYLLQDQPAKAAAIIQEVLQDNSSNAEVLEVLGRSQMQLGQVRQAAQTFERLTSILPNAPVGFYRLAVAYQQLGELAAARRAVDRAINLGLKDIEAKLLLADIAANTGDEATLARVLPELENNPEVIQSVAYKDLSASLALMDGDRDKAVALLEEANQVEPTAYRTLRLSGVEITRGSMTAAVDRLEDWLAEHPGDQQVGMRLSYLYRSSGQLPKAEEVMKEVVERNPNSWPALNDLAWLHYLDGDLGAAREHAERALSLAPDQPFVLDTYGSVLLAEGETDKAADYLERAVQAMPNSTSSRFSLAKAYAATDRSDQAVRELRRLLADSDNFAERTDAEALLNSLTDQ